jgi:hypothetical protein
VTENPYGRELAGREPLTSLADSAEQIRSLVAGFDQPAWLRSYAEGKWTAAQIAQHLAHCELFLGTRVRLALTVPNYVVQPFEQDDLMRIEVAESGPTAFASYYAQRQMNLPFFRQLTAAQLDHPVHHPEKGGISVRWIIELFAGHDWRHIGQLREIVHSTART